MHVCITFVCVYVYMCAEREYASFYALLYNLYMTADSHSSSEVRRQGPRLVRRSYDPPPPGRSVSQYTKRDALLLTGGLQRVLYINKWSVTMNNLSETVNLSR